MAYVYEKNALVLHGHRVDLEADIKLVLEFKERIIVLFESSRYEPGSANEDRNVIALDADGNQSWRIQGAG